MNFLFYESKLYYIRFSVFILYQLRWILACCQCGCINDAIKMNTARVSQLNMISVLNACSTLHHTAYNTTSGTTSYLVFHCINRVEEHIAPQQPRVPVVLPKPLVSSYPVDGHILSVFPPGQSVVV